MRQSVVEVRQSVLEEVTVCSRGGETVCSRGGETVCIRGVDIPSVAEEVTDRGSVVEEVRQPLVDSR